MPPYSYALPQRNLVQQKESAIIENANIPRSRFIYSWTRKTSFDAGYLVPIAVEEVLPGDHVSYTIHPYLRMSTPLFPLLDNQRVDIFAFFCPMRLLWDNFKKMMGEQATPTDSIAFSMPKVGMDVGGYIVGTIYDHMGLPTVGQISAGQQMTDINAAPLRMYNFVWNTWFRDENLQNSVTELRDNGPDPSATYALLRRAKQPDYFTTLLPWTQKFTAPVVPLSGISPVTGLGIADQGGTVAGPVTSYETTGTQIYSFYQHSPLGGALEDFIMKMSNAAGASSFPVVYADLAQGSGSIAINALRQAWMVQSLLERDARGGTRYIELVRSHFGVTSSDARLQRPEYIGGGQVPLNVTPIAQTAPTAGVPLGALGGAGVAAGRVTASYASEEHGYILILANIRTELTYQQGVRKLWLRNTRYDFYWPALAQMGEQAVYNKEIFATGVTAADDTVLGYQERWHEYRTHTSEAVGLMRSTSAGNIDEWHFGQQFTAAPTLNTTFIQDTPPMTRVLAAGASADGMQYFGVIQFDCVHTRPIPTYGTPAILGRF